MNLLSRAIPAVDHLGSDVDGNLFIYSLFGCCMMITTFRFEKIAVLPLDREQDDFYNDTTKRDKSKEVQKPSELITAKSP